MAAPKTLLFYRDFQTYSGGHQKVFDYFCHAAASGNYAPKIAFSAPSRWDGSNPWLQHRAGVVAWEPERHTALFVAGMDWAHVPDTYAGPVINLVQHVRHADPADPRYAFLGRRALRICVGPEVAAALVAIGYVNGPLFTVPNGVGIPELSRIRATDFYILGTKNPGMCGELQRRLVQCGYSVKVQVERVQRQRVLEGIAASRVAIVLPRTTEGFFLPALESMALAEITVVPDCVGNRSFCSDGVNCLMPGYTAAELEQAARHALEVVQDGGSTLATFRSAAGQTVAAFSLAKERDAFLRILGSLDELWAGGG